MPLLQPVMLAVGSPELLAFSFFGLSMVATLSGRAPLKGLTAAGIGLMILARRGRDVPIPFGPYLAGAGLIALFWGKAIVDRSLAQLL